jgi:DNA polymerase-3 subunit gamma/tau
VAYQALYRKYRPQRFGEVVGQDHVTLTLAREVQQGRLVHAYLFAGPRGTGKTTTARIIAKVLNCPDLGADGEPCNRCASCLAIAEGTSLDVIELDAASHNKVEDVREIRANVSTVASTGGARRVYILDEAHMLSRAAANALLKTLEEPPEHAYFVLATTEPYKLPDTIRSRAQRFDFHPIGSETLQAYLAEIAARERYRAAPEGLTLIARHAGGSVRDALGLLEQVAALGSGKVEARGVTRALGLAPSEAFTRLAQALADHDAAGALALAASIAAEGADLRRFVADAIGFFRGVFLARYAPNLEEIVDEPAEVLAEFRAQARVLEGAEVLRAVEVLGEALVALREGREERLVVELALLRLARPETSVDAPSLAARLDRVEERMRRLADVVPAGRGEEPPPTGAGSRLSVPEPPPRRRRPSPVPGGRGKEAVTANEGSAPGPNAGPPAGGFDLGALEAVWPALVERVRVEAGPRRHAMFRVCRPAAVEGNRLVFEVPGNLTFHLAHLVEDRGLTRVVAAIAGRLLGGEVDIAYRAGDGDGGEGTPAEAGAVGEEEPSEESGRPAGDATAVVTEILGGEVVSND